MGKNYKNIQFHLRKDPVLNSIHVHVLDNLRTYDTTHRYGRPLFDNVQIIQPPWLNHRNRYHNHPSLRCHPDWVLPWHSDVPYADETILPSRVFPISIHVHLLAGFLLHPIVHPLHSLSYVFRIFVVQPRISPIPLEIPYFRARFPSDTDHGSDGHLDI